MLRMLRAAGMGLLLAILASPLTAQTQSLQAWPEVDTYVSVNSDVRVSFFAAATRENRQGTSCGDWTEYRFLLQALGEAEKDHHLRVGSIKEQAVDVSVRIPLHAVDEWANRASRPIGGNWPLPARQGVLLSDRNRLDLRSIDGELAWRYRNRISAERTVAIRSYHFTPYLRAEAYYDGNFHKWSRTAETAGCIFPFRKRYEVEPYYEHQNDTGTAPNRQVNALGLVLSMYF